MYTAVEQEDDTYQSLMALMALMALMTVWHCPMQAAPASAVSLLN